VFDILGEDVRGKYRASQWGLLHVKRLVAPRAGRRSRATAACGRPLRAHGAKGAVPFSMEVRPTRLPARVLGFSYWKKRAKIYVADVPFAIVKIWDGRYAATYAVALNRPRETVRVDMHAADALLYRLFTAMREGAVEFHEGYAYVARVDGGALLHFEADKSTFYVRTEGYEVEVHDLSNAVENAERFLGAERARAVREFLRAVAQA